MTQSASQPVTPLAHLITRGPQLCQRTASITAILLYHITQTLGDRNINSFTTDPVNALHFAITGLTQHF